MLLLRGRREGGERRGREGGEREERGRREGGEREERGRREERERESCDVCVCVFMLCSSKEEASLSARYARAQRNDALDLKFGYERYVTPKERVGWLINMHSVSVCGCVGG